MIKLIEVNDQNMADVQKHAGFTDTLISDFSDPSFQSAFRTYFSDMGVKVNDWDGLFREMDGDGELAFLRTSGDGHVIGFILFNSIKFTSWFFEETYGFIREFWIAEMYRNNGHGTALLRLAENYFREHGIYASILTTDTAERFYLKHGYQKNPNCIARNKFDVFMKRLA